MDHVQKTFGQPYVGSLYEILGAVGPNSVRRLVGAIRFASKFVCT